MSNIRVLPAFVYGTLRPGLGNHSWALAGRTTSEVPATLSGARMFDNNRSFPFVTMSDSTESDVVVGNLMYIHEDLFVDVLADLDGLEGFRGEGEPSNLYDRKVVTVTLSDGSQAEAYTYLVADRLYESRIKHSPVIASGDWLAHLSATVRAPRSVFA